MSDSPAIEKGKTRPMIGIWLDIDIAIIALRQMIVQIRLNRDDWINDELHVQDKQKQ